MMDENEKSDLIISIVKSELDKQYKDIINYMNEFMTQEERNLHGDNIASYLIQSPSLLARIKLELMAKGL